MEDASQTRRANDLLWLLLLAHLAAALLCDFCATIYSLFIPTPVPWPDIGTLSGFLWFFFSLLILRALLKQFCKGIVPGFANVLSVMFAFGYGVYMVGNSVQAKLWILKYNDELSHVTSYPGVDSKVLPVFRLLYFYDEILGHLLIFIPYFLLFVMTYAYSLRPAEEVAATSNPSRYPWWMVPVVVLTSLSFAWGAVEGQSVPLYGLIVLLLLTIKVYRRQRGCIAGAYGKTMEAIFGLSVLWIFVWWGVMGHFKEMPQVFETLGRVLNIG